MCLCVGYSNCTQCTIQCDTFHCEMDLRPDSPTSGEPTRTVCYAQVGFEDYRPVPAPPVEGVTYADPIAVGEEEVSVWTFSVYSDVHIQCGYFLCSLVCFR